MGVIGDDTGLMGLTVGLTVGLGVGLAEWQWDGLRVAR
jgi:hypothetical protein